MSDLVVMTQIQPGLSELVLNRPDRRNALSINLLDALCSHFDQLEKDSTQRVVILRGAGPVFSAGLDFQDATTPGLEETIAAKIEKTLRTLRKTPLIVIAAVAGGAFAGGAGVMAACDLVIAADTAKIGFPEARRGLVPALICEPLRHKVREGDLRDLFLAGDLIDARRAQEIGLVQRIAPLDGLREEAIAVAQAVLAGGPETIRLTKKLLNQIYHADESAQLTSFHLAARRTGEAAEGMTAFLEKRPPAWTQLQNPKA